jgi:LacI family transcriptional regulator
MPKRATLRPPYQVQTITPYYLEYFREALLGARHYGFDTGRLEFVDHWLEHELRGNLKALIRRDRVSGIITCINSAESIPMYQSLGIPVVNISNSFVSPQIPLVTQDDHSVGRLAAQHLLSCGCQSFAFWGVPKGSFSVERLAGYREALRLAGTENHLYINQAPSESRGNVKVYRKMCTWLSRLPRPLGIFAVLDSIALMLIRACRELGLRVPEDVAILGAGNDDFHVDFESVPLSSIQLPAREIGRSAAELLDQLITHRQRHPPDRHLPVSEIALRKSTDVLFIDDPAISRAVHFIREHATETIYLNDVVRASGVCRTVLQRRFRQKLGRTISDEIQRLRIARAQSLLAQTDLAMSWVAEKSGFSNPQQFSLLFHRATGLSPSAYRRQFREKE